ncbi:MAG: efflux RND transporter periplasmic adaptor subunit [Proteobacteria bacterium]|nr:efflux RND transporter periplasmic adaptor subunit [Pseudomonadota bacterium]
MDLNRLKIDKKKLNQNGRNRKKIITALIILSVIFLMIANQKGLLGLTKKVKETSVSLLYPYQTITVFNASGYVTAGKKASVSSKITGKIKALYVEEGSRVKKNQILAVLEDDEPKTLKKQAEAQIEITKKNIDVAKEDLKEAERQYLRNKNLYEKGLIPKSNYDLSETNFKKALATLDSLKAHLKLNESILEGTMVSIDNTIIKAPFDGVILTKNADVGDIVTPIGSAVTAKASVVDMADLTTLYVEADVSEAYIEKVKLNQPVIIRLDAFPENFYKGKVHSIIPTVDRTKASVTIKINFIDKDDRVLPDMSAKVSFLSRELKKEELNPVMVVNKKAIMKEANKSYVYIIKDSKALKKEIATGREFEENTEVISGLQYGEKVVLNPPKGLKDGSKIKVIEE